MRWGRWLTSAAGLGIAGASLFAARSFLKRSPQITSETQRASSYWIDSIPELPRFPCIDEHIRVDVAVIGGGFTGLALAYYLKQLEPSLRVAVLEAQRLGSGASSRNSGAATPYFSDGTSEASLRGFALLRDFCAAQEIDVDLQESVPIITLHRHADTCAAPDLTGADLQSQIGSPYYEAARTATSNRLHPGKLITGLIDATRDAGVELYEYSPVTHLQQGDPHWLQTPSGRVAADRVALATNAYTPGLGIATERIMAIHHRVIATRPLSDSEWEMSGLHTWPYRLESGGVYTHTVRTTADRRFFYRHVLGHRPFEQPDWTISDRDRATGEREMLRRYPWLDGIPIDYEWHGITAATGDKWPLAGELADRLYIAAGYNGTGVMTSHFFGHILAHLITGHDHEDMSLMRSPDSHPRYVGEMARNIKMRASIQYARYRDA